MPGSVDTCSVSHVSGWAVEEGRPGELDILVNATSVARIRCELPRPDVQAQGHPPDAGFNFAFPDLLTISDVVSVRLRDGTDLWNSPLAPRVNQGAVELCTASGVSGWAVELGRPARLEVLVNGVRVAEIQCDRLNPALVAHGLPETAGFAFRFKQHLSERDEVAVRFLDGAELTNSPLRPKLHEGNIDSCRVSKVSGWAAFGGRPAELDIFVNDQRVVRIRCDGERPDLAAAGAPSNAGFAFRFLPPVAPSDIISVRYVDGVHVNGSPRAPQAILAAQSRRDSWQHKSKVVILLGMRDSDMARCAGLLESLNFKTDEATAVVPVYRRDRWEMIDFHERALGLIAAAAAGADAVDLPEILQRSPALQSIVDEMEEWLAERAKRFSPCFVRDVRAAQVLPLWNAIFASVDLKPLYVLCLQNPAGEDVEAVSARARDASAAQWTEFYCSMLAALSGTGVCILPSEDWRDGGEANVIRLKRYLKIDPRDDAAGERVASGEIIDTIGIAQLESAGSFERAKSLYRMIAACASSYCLDDAALDAAHKFAGSKPAAKRAAARSRRKSGEGENANAAARYTNIRPAWIEIARAGGLFAMNEIKRMLTSRYEQREAFSIYQVVMRYAGESRLVRRTQRPLREFASQNATSFDMLDPGGAPYSIEPPEVIGEGNHATLVGVSRPIYLACIKDARVRGYSAFIEVGDLALFDDEPDEPARLGEQIDFDPAIFRAEDDAVWITAPKDGETVRLDEAFYLLGCRTRVFGHWMWEYLPKFIAASMSGKLPLAPMLIDANMPATHREALEMLLPPGTGIVELAPYATARVDRLWCAPSQMRLPLLLKMGPQFKWDYETSPPERFAPIIREMALRTLSRIPLADGAERVYLARKPTTHRKLVNHAIIEAVASARGFRIVYPEQMTFSQQAATLRAARLVIAPEGSALFLAFFSQPGAKICILEHPHTAGLAIYNGLFRGIGLETVVFTGPFVRFDEDWPHMSDYQIDETAFARFLNAWIGRQSQ